MLNGAERSGVECGGDKVNTGPGQHRRLNWKQMMNEISLRYQAVYGLGNPTFKKLSCLNSLYF